MKTTLFRSLSLAAILTVASAALISSTVTAQSAAEAYVAKSEQTRKIADEFFQLYLHAKVDQLRPFYAENATWHDPTAGELWGMTMKSGVDTIIEHHKQVLKGLVTNELTIERSFFSGSYAHYTAIMDFTWYSPDKSTSKHFKLPISVVLKIENGKITEHRDYGDYVTWLEYSKKDSQG